MTTSFGLTTTFRRKIKTLTQNRFIIKNIKDTSCATNIVIHSHCQFVNIKNLTELFKYIYNIKFIIYSVL